MQPTSKRVKANVTPKTKNSNGFALNMKQLSVLSDITIVPEELEECRKTCEAKQQELQQLQVKLCEARGILVITYQSSYRRSRPGVVQFRHQSYNQCYQKRIL